MSGPLHVVGAGPVGALWALMLARRGFAVEVHERRPDLRREQISAGRSINLAVSTRGLHALSQWASSARCSTPRCPCAAG